MYQRASGRCLLYGGDDFERFQSFAGQNHGGGGPADDTAEIGDLQCERVAVQHGDPFMCQRCPPIRLGGVMPKVE